MAPMGGAFEGYSRAFAWRAAFQECNLAGGGAASIVVYRVAQTLFEGLKLPLSATVKFAVPFEAFSKGMALRERFALRQDSEIAN